MADENDPQPGDAASGAAAPDGARSVRPNAYDPLGINEAALEVLRALFAHPESAMATQMQWANAWMSAAARALTPPASAQPAPLIEPAPGDNRWKHAAWSENPLFDAVKQGYLLATKAVLDGIDRAPDVDAETKTRVKYFTKQFCDAMSPTNMAFLNPTVIEETLKTGGANLQKGAQNMLEDLRENRGRPALVDKKAFEIGRNVATTKGAVVYRNEVMELLQYAPATETVYRRPLVVIPPWINKYYIMDLRPSNSLIKFAVDSGFQIFLVSWINPDASMSHLQFEDYLESGAIAAARIATKIAGANDVNLLGYCLGGTLVSMVLAYLERKGEPLANAATLFATLVDFSEPGDLKNFLSPEAIECIQHEMQEKGILEASAMSDTFNLLRANDLIWNVAVNRYLLGKDAPAFDLLYWNSDSTRLTADFHSYYLRNMYVENNLVKPDGITMNGVPLDLRRVRNDVYSVAAKEDHIAPWPSVYKSTQLFGGDVQFRLAHSGHIAGIINSPAAGKGNYWKAPRNPPLADEWFGIAQKVSGSFWPEWSKWLAARSGEMVPAPAAAGSAEYPPLGPAPGTYVLVKA
ncbi:MAG: class I poly(R)-hydroxyalkanoic acid synthase [Candidatus Baltobacteraceae bacterium]|jgi:polyhydroxyalkanoate synthase